jgi:hypothetical protein
MGDAQRAQMKTEMESAGQRKLCRAPALHSVRWRTERRDPHISDQPFLLDARRVRELRPKLRLALRR